MVFITAGMGGGTGTGAAPVIARMARERNILTVGVVTKPFTFEGTRRARSAELGIAELQQYVDTLIVIPNQNLFLKANEKTTWREAFKMADNVLYMGVRGVTDLMVTPGMVNLDFADIRTVMAEMGKAMMGTGEADGDNRAIRAAEAAISNPLLEETNMAGARGLLINITGGDDLTLFEVDQAANRIRQEVAEEANIIFGSAIDANLEGRIRVSVVATGIDTPVAQAEPVGPRLRIAVGGGAPIPMPMAAQAAYAAQQQTGPAPHASNVVQLEAVAPEPVLAEPAPRQATAAGHGLFTPAAEAQASPARPSLFKRATFGLRRNHAEPEARLEPQIGEPEPTATVRQSAAEAEVAGLDIPAFLRRQH
jgi:cell division protein FtsZ